MQFQNLQAEAQWNITPYQQQRNRHLGRGNYKLIRYADDFVILSNDSIAGVREVKQAVKEFLNRELHLELSEEKTKLAHINDGFVFLGFHIQRVRSLGKWAVHLRPSPEAKTRVKEKIKNLTTRQFTTLDEYTELIVLNDIVRGWAEYYKHTSLYKDIEEITRFTWYRYLSWLLKKHKGSHKWELVKAKTKIRYNRTRWVAEVRQEDKTLMTYQWLPSHRELKRTRYLQKGRNGFAHPYLEVGTSKQRLSG